MLITPASESNYLLNRITAKYSGPNAIHPVTSWTLDDLALLIPLSLCLFIIKCLPGRHNYYYYFDFYITMITLFFKGGLPVEAFKYQPIGITSINELVYERTNTYFIAGHFHRKHIVHNTHCGFLNEHSCLPYLLSALGVEIMSTRTIS